MELYMDGSTPAIKTVPGYNEEGCWGPGREGACCHVKQVYGLFSSSTSLSVLKAQPGIKPPSKLHKLTQNSKTSPRNESLGNFLHTCCLLVTTLYLTGIRQLFRAGRTAGQAWKQLNKNAAVCVIPHLHHDLPFLADIPKEAPPIASAAI